MKRDWLFESFVIVMVAIIAAVVIAGWEASKYIAEPGSRDQGAIALAIAIAALIALWSIVRWFANKARK